MKVCIRTTGVLPALDDACEGTTAERHPPPTPHEHEHQMCSVCHLPILNKKKKGSRWRYAPGYEATVTRLPQEN